MPLGVAFGLVVGLCLVLPASAQMPDRPDADAARKEGNLSWYTSTPFPLVQHLVDKFQQETGIKIQLLRTGGQAVLRRFQQARIDVAPPPGQPALSDMKFIPVDLDLIEEKGRELKARFSEIFQ